jgi:FixJ family two-component response regulator
MKAPSIRGSTVAVLSDDACHQGGLKELLGSVGLQVELFAWGNAFRQSPLLDTAGCIVLDVRFPLSGLKFQSDLAKAKIQVPIIFLTGLGDIPMAVRAMKAGAVDFLTKPFREQDLLHAVAAAIEMHGARRAKELSNSILNGRFDSLTSRERDIVARVAAGALNKQIAADLGISEVTVKVYRANAMRKLRAKSVAELVRITVQAESLTTFRNEVGKTESGELAELFAPVTIPESAVDPRSRTSRLAILPDHTPKLTARE